MKRDKATIDDILRRHLKSASKEEVESAGAEVFNRLRDELQDAMNKFTLVYRQGIDEPIPEPEPELLPLQLYDHFVLLAVSLLRGEGDVLEVLNKVNELAAKVLWPGSVCSALGRLERTDLIQSRDDTLRTTPDGQPVERYKITPRGERALASANMAAERVREDLEDLI
jgi:hypothetical protein